ncbi:hypothetical protein [Azospira oryzae]|jgi:ElaB/YqjD/DUF883 family membrane-anchored ribosome-binding protein|uniref:hypothetical protein n=1 Tax=Azospira oryzae TaxID=146939 RepID=UPI001963C3E7|nr:hypothetical protein [Azospira oryzae]
MSIENGGEMEAGNVVSRSLDKVARNAHEAIDKTRSMACPPADGLAGGAHQVVEKIAGAAQQVAANVSMGSAQLRLASSRVAASCRNQVCARPLSSLGLAVGIGIAVGWLSGYFRRDR